MLEFKTTNLDEMKMLLVGIGMYIEYLKNMRESSKTTSSDQQEIKERLKQTDEIKHRLIAAIEEKEKR